MKKRTFEAPGPGSWELDATHFQKPTSRYTAEILPDQMIRGFKYGTERFGLLLSHLKPVFIHGFCYMKPMIVLVPEDAPPGPPPEGFFEIPELVARIESGVKAIENKLWREDLKHWDEEVKPDSIHRNKILQSVSPESLSNEELIKHLIECRNNIAEMYFRHHKFTIPSILPTGLYLGKVCQWTGLSPGEVLDLLKGSSPVSAGLAAKELEHLASLLKQNGIAPDQFKGQSPDEVIQSLRNMSGPVGSALADYLDLVGYRLTSGYDITERYALEMPELLVANIWSELTNLDNKISDDDYDVRLLLVRNKVPGEYQQEFDFLLEEARVINRLRDERGVFNESKAFGLARRAILEGGKRLKSEGRLNNASTLLHASHDEMLSLLRGENGPSETDLINHEHWYQNNSTDDAPPWLGSPPEPPPPLEALPENARLAEGAIGAAIGNIFDLPVTEDKAEESITGLTVSNGVYEGTARIIRNPSDFKRLQQGDVLVTRNTSAAFNVVLPMLGAIVTDRGGQLSHAAIVAREYGIPCIVSTRISTKAIPDGAQVRVNGASGIVEILS